MHGQATPGGASHARFRQVSARCQTLLLSRECTGAGTSAKRLRSSKLHCAASHFNMRAEA